MIYDQAPRQHMIIRWQTISSHASRKLSRCHSISYVKEATIALRAATRLVSHRSSCRRQPICVTRAMAPKQRGSQQKSSCSSQRAVLWFRKGLRLHDNPALNAALDMAPESLTPVFCLDPWYVRLVEETETAAADRL